MAHAHGGGVTMMQRYSRRSFLKATSFAAGLLPLLESDLVRGSCLLPGRKRLITLCWGNGLLEWVRGTGSDFTMPAFMGSLEPHRGDLVIPNALWSKAYHDGYPTDLN